MRLLSGEQKNPKPGSIPKKDENLERGAGNRVSFN